MRIMKAIINVLLITVVAPIVVTTTLSFAFSPLQMVARASEPAELVDVSDTPLVQAEAHVGEGGTEPLYA